MSIINFIRLRSDQIPSPFPNPPHPNPAARGSRARRRADAREALPVGTALRHRDGRVVELVVRPTGLVDPPVEVRPAKGQVDDVVDEVRLRTEKKERVLITTLTKRSAEELTDYLVDSGSFKIVIYSTVAISALLFLPSISVTVRRLQDLNISYFWALPYFITYILGFYVILNQGEENAERLNSISSLLFIVYLLVFAKKGDYKKNRFGENPLEKES